MRIKDLLKASGLCLIIPKNGDDWNQLSLVVSAITQVFGRKQPACANRQIMLEFNTPVDIRGYTASNKYSVGSLSSSPAFLLGSVPLCEAEGLLKFCLVDGSHFSSTCTLGQLPQLSKSTRLIEEDCTRCVMPAQRGAEFWEQLLFMKGLSLDSFLEKHGSDLVIIDLSPGVGCLAAAALSRAVPYIGCWNNKTEYRGSDWQKYALPTYKRLVSEEKNLIYLSQMLIKQ